MKRQFKGIKFPRVVSSKFACRARQMPEQLDMFFDNVVERRNWWLADGEVKYVVQAKKDGSVGES